MAFSLVARNGEAERKPGGRELRISSKAAYRSSLDLVECPQNERSRGHGQSTPPTDVKREAQPCMHYAPSSQ